jgi:hypothetical protein
LEMGRLPRRVAAPGRRKFDRQLSQHVSHGLRDAIRGQVEVRP